YEGTPAEFDPLGFYDTVEYLTLEELRYHHSEYFRPEKSCLMVSASLPPGELIKRVETNLLSYARAADTTFGKNVELLAKPKKTILPVKDVSQSLEIAFHIPTDFYEVRKTLLFDIFNHGESSLLFGA